MKIELDYIIGISVFSGVIRAIIDNETFSFYGFLRRVFLSVFVGYSASLYFHDKLADPKYVTAVILCAFVSDDILLGILKISGHIRDNATNIIKKK